MKFHKGYQCDLILFFKVKTLKIRIQALISLIMNYKFQVYHVQLGDLNLWIHIYIYICLFVI